MAGTNLETAFAKELVARAERNLDDGGDLGHFAGRRVFYVSDALKIGGKLLDDGLPSGETLDEEVSGIEILRLNFFANEGA